MTSNGPGEIVIYVNIYNMCMSNDVTLLMNHISQGQLTLRRDWFIHIISNLDCPQQDMNMNNMNMNIRLRHTVTLL